MKTNPRVYVMGPMTDITDMNRPAFEHAAECLRLAGYEPVLPADLITAGVKQYDSPGALYRDVLPKDIDLIAGCDAAVALPGYERSKGCDLEVHVCDVMDIPVCVPPYNTDEWLTHADTLGLYEWVSDAVDVLDALKLPVQA